MAKNKLAPNLKWVYAGRSKAGVLVCGVIQAPSAIVARVKLRKKEIIPYSLKQQNGLSLSKLLGAILRRVLRLGESQSYVSVSRLEEIHRWLAIGSADKTRQQKLQCALKEKELTLFVKQFVVVIKSGVPLLKAFDIVSQGLENKKFSLILADIKFAVENGSPLSESFGRYPKVFDPLFIRFLAIGEQAGILEDLLQRYVEYQEKINAVRRRVKSTLAYPLIVLLVSGLVLSLLLAFVVPQFQQLFSGMGSKLPAPTLLVIRLSDLIVDYWWLLLAGMALSVVGFKLAYRKLVRFRFFIDSLVFRIPLFGDLAQKVLILRWTRTLALLFAAGIPLNEALRSIALLVDNYLYTAATLNVQNDVEAGSSLYNAMLISNVFPNLVTQMVAVGEESGTLEISLKSVADYYEQELEVLVETLLSLLEPLTILILGGLLGSIIVAIYLPLFNLGNVVG